LASIITLSFFLNNCNSEKRFGFREKVRVYHNSNSAKVFQKNPTKSLDVLTISNEKNIAPKLKEGTIILKNAKHSIPFELLTASIDTPKPYEIKKLPVVEEVQNTSVSVAKPEHNGVNVGLVFVGIGVLVIVVVLLLVIVVVLLLVSFHIGDVDNIYGCAFTLVGLIISAIGGLIILISSQVNN